ncbi:MAG: AmmeMemoRadiSam system protein B [Candidatus Bathyarchaeota archaeon]|nr:AmmeMemoRadiSam system protein B [Candidatus Bathyarchaeota archaeon]
MFSRVRYPRAAGSYYAGSTESLKRQIEQCFTGRFGPGELPKTAEGGPRKIVGLVSPHAGYMCSGAIAAHAFYQLAKDGNPETLIILGPSHLGYPGFSTMLEGIWKTPLGDAHIDSELAGEIVKHSQFLDVSSEAHHGEHSLEVQLPFAQYVYNADFKIVPIIAGYSDYGMCEDVGLAIAKAIKEKRKNVALVGSTDFTHYGSFYGYAPVGMKSIQKIMDWMYRVDDSLIETVLSLDAEKLFKTVSGKGYTMCGYIPVAVMMVAIKELGAKQGRLLKYATSYDITGSSDAIVGYAAAVFEKQNLGWGEN